MIQFKTLARCLSLSVLLTGCAQQLDDSVSRTRTPLPHVDQGGKVVAGLQEKKFKAYITGYSFWDNTPPGSAAIARPVIHRKAGGTGTYRDPITIAVGHTIIRGKQTLDYPAGTRFYLPRLRKYVIVEDVCGDGLQPQYGPCHSGHNGYPWLDVYVGGKRTGADQSNRCMYSLTGVQNIVMNPRPGYPVAAGPIAESGCQTYQG